MKKIIIGSLLGLMGTVHAVHMRSHEDAKKDENTSVTDLLANILEKADEADKAEENQEKVQEKASEEKEKAQEKASEEKEKASEKKEGKVDKALDKIFGPPLWAILD